MGDNQRRVFWAQLSKPMQVKRITKKTREHGKGLCALIVVALLVFAAAEALWATYANHNRVEPVMDYVSQEIGIYDTTYWELDELDCRNCHGNSLADRHHLTDAVLIYGLCTPCHEVIAEQPFVVIIRDCLTGGCHSWDDVETNGWHHNTDLSVSGNCVACHDPNLIEEITPVRDFATYPPSVATPTPFTCENCHWGQDYMPGGDPEDPGHPSTYDHYDAENEFVGFYEYSRPIYGNMDTHHMGFCGDLSSQCYECHSLDPNHPDWDPSNAELIRYCERCHSAGKLHSIGPHMQGGSGWEAVGFHVPFSNTQTRDLDPTAYRTWDPAGPYAPEATEGFTAEQICVGCHGDEVPDFPDEEDCTGMEPVIDRNSEGIQPNQGACGTVVTLRGQNFGQLQTQGRKAQMKLKGQGNPWTDVPVISWTETRVEFQIPCATFVAGNHKVRVKTECGKSNRVNFALAGSISIASVSPAEIERGEALVTRGFGFGETQIDGQVRIGRKGQAEDPSLGQGKLQDRIKAWSDTRIKVKVKVPAAWEGKKRYVWIEKDGTKSNYKALEILDTL